MKHLILFPLNNGTVIDGTHGLQWSQATLSDDNNSHAILTIKEAIFAASDADIHGFSDWRLPTLSELATLIDPVRAGIVAIDPVLFPDTAPERYWTSTAIGTDALKIYYVDFHFGGVSHALGTELARVRLVRDVT